MSQLEIIEIISIIVYSTSVVHHPNILLLVSHYVSCLHSTNNKNTGQNFLSEKHVNNLFEKLDQLQS